MPSYAAVRTQSIGHRAKGRGERTTARNSQLDLESFCRLLNSLSVLPKPPSRAYAHLLSLAHLLTTHRSSTFARILTFPISLLSLCTSFGPAPALLFM